MNKKDYNKLFDEFKDDFESWKPHYREISTYMSPRKGRYLTSDSESQHNDGRKKHNEIINGAALDGLRVLAAGMQGGLTSPSRAWFRLAYPDEELMEVKAVKIWLHSVEKIMFSIFARSNFYSSIHSMYKELAAFGTAVMLVEEDFSSVVRFRPFTIGECYLSLDFQYRVDSMCRRISLTAKQLVQQFGIDKVSRRVKEAINKEQKDIDERFEVLHFIHPNNKTIYGETKVDQKFAYASVYYEKNGETDEFLRRSGYKEMPFVAPRWDVTSTDVYGNSPGMDVLGDAKMLQRMEEKGLKALDKMIDPPMVADPALQKSGATLVAGGVNYLDQTAGQRGFAPAYQVNPDLNGMAAATTNVERRIGDGFYKSLFLSLLPTTKRMTATEVSGRYEEKLLMLGPIIERLESEVLDNIIARTFNIISSFGIFPIPPPEIIGLKTGIEYISMLAQAQKLVGATAIERTAEFVSVLAPTNPEVVDKLDFDETIDQYGEIVGIPPNMIRSDDDVAEIRRQRAEQQQQIAQQEQALAAIEGAKGLSEIPLDGDNALNSIAEGGA